MEYIKRNIEPEVIRALDNTPVTANKTYAIECKSSLSPGLTKRIYNGIEDIKPQQTFVVSPVKSGWPVKKNIDITLNN